MKKILLILLFVFGVSAISNAQMTPFYKSDKIDNTTIYFFTKNNCPYCNHAAAYIAKKHPNLKVEFKDVSEQNNINLMLSCAEKFNLDRRRLGTPLICIGQNYILGWSPEEEEKFDAYFDKIKN